MSEYVCSTDTQTHIHTKSISIAIIIAYVILALAACMRPTRQTMLLREMAADAVPAPISNGVGMKILNFRVPHRGFCKY